jgi:hypothetical protein
MAAQDHNEENDADQDRSEFALGFPTLMKFQLTKGDSVGDSL